MDEEESKNREVFPIKCVRGGLFEKWFRKCQEEFKKKRGFPMSDPDTLENLATQFQGQFIP